MHFCYMQEEICQHTRSCVAQLQTWVNLTLSTSLCIWRTITQPGIQGKERLLGSAASRRQLAITLNNIYPRLFLSFTGIHCEKRKNKKIKVNFAEIRYYFFYQKGGGISIVKGQVRLNQQYFSLGISLILLLVSSSQCLPSGLRWFQKQQRLWTNIYPKFWQNYRRRLLQV